MKRLDLNINIKALLIILATLFFLYQHIGFGIEKKLGIDLPYCDYEMFLKSLVMWLLSWSMASRFEFIGTKWLKPITMCFIFALSFSIAEVSGVAESHFSFFSLIWLACIAGIIIQRERIKWYLQRKNSRVLYIILGLLLTWN